MELIFIVLWTVGVLLGCQLCVLWKTHGSFPQILKKLPDRIRSGLGVVSDRAKEHSGNFYRLEQQVHVREVPGTTAE